MKVVQCSGWKFHHSLLFMGSIFPTYSHPKVVHVFFPIHIPNNYSLFNGEPAPELLRVSQPSNRWWLLLHILVHTITCTSITVHNHLLFLPLLTLLIGGLEHPNWLSYFSESLKPPIRYMIFPRWYSLYDIPYCSWGNHLLFLPLLPLVLEFLICFLPQLWQPGPRRVCRACWASQHHWSSGGWTSAERPGKIRTLWRFVWGKMMAEIFSWCFFFFFFGF